MDEPLKVLAQILAREGINGDGELLHVRQDEIPAIQAALKTKGHINPKTGVLSFFDGTATGGDYSGGDYGYSLGGNENATSEAAPAEETANKDVDMAPYNENPAPPPGFTDPAFSMDFTGITTLDKAQNQAFNDLVDSGATGRTSVNHSPDAALNAMMSAATLGIGSGANLSNASGQTFANMVGDFLTYASPFGTLMPSTTSFFGLFDNDASKGAKAGMGMNTMPGVMNALSWAVEMFSDQTQSTAKEAPDDAAASAASSIGTTSANDTSGGESSSKGAPAKPSNPAQAAVNVLDFDMIRGNINSLRDYFAKSAKTGIKPLNIAADSLKFDLPSWVKPVNSAKKA
jgi:hypothetical protein